MSQRYVDAPDWSSYAEEVYSTEYANAVARAILSKLSGMEYEAFIADNLFVLERNINDPDLADVAALRRAVAERKDGARIARPFKAAEPNCNNAQRCANIRLNPAVVEEFDLQPVIEDVLRNPCSHALKPEAYQSRPGAWVRNGLPPVAVWRTLWLCDFQSASYRRGSALRW
ncbi:MAG: hypothetical protein KL785_07785 [Brevundimonas sp.]|nr:hypothetical protein [Brevundimonas sp.]